jgi:hypothetical protein
MSGADMTKQVQQLVHRSITSAFASGVIHFTAHAEPVYKQLNPKFCWFRPRVLNGRLDRLLAPCLYVRCSAF